MLKKLMFALALTVLLGVVAGCGPDDDPQEPVKEETSGETDNHDDDDQDDEDGTTKTGENEADTDGE